MAFNEEEQLILDWVKTHHMEDKDAQMRQLAEDEAAEKEQSRTNRSKQRRSPAAWELPMPEDEIDLHGFTADEAAEAVERRIDDLLIAGLSILRVIHGGGNPEYGNVKHIIDRKVRSEWKNKVIFYKIEPDNAGSSIMKIGKPRPQNPRSRKKT